MNYKSTTEFEEDGKETKGNTPSPDPDALAGKAQIKAHCKVKQSIELGVIG